MSVTYDPARSERNEAKRGLAFNLAEAFDWSTALIVEDTRKDYEEHRYQALGMIGEHLHMLVLIAIRARAVLFYRRRLN